MPGDGLVVGVHFTWWIIEPVGESVILAVALAFPLASFRHNLRRSATGRAGNPSAEGEENRSRMGKRTEPENVRMDVKVIRPSGHGL